jgi:hypothetical protein
MAELSTGGVRVKIEIWYDRASRKITFSNVDQDFGPKGLIGSFIPGIGCGKARARAAGAPREAAAVCCLRPMGSTGYCCYAAWRMA